MKVQGTTENTQLRHSLRLARAAYMRNVRLKKFPLNAVLLARMDALLRKVDGQAKAVARQRQEPQRAL
jgi:hypothetical protein